MTSSSASKPRPARGHLGGARRLVDAALAAQHEAEVLDRVGDVDPLAVDADLGQRAVQHLARRPHERRALEVFLIAGLLAHQHDAGVGGTAAEHHLGGVAVQLAALAAGGGRAQLLERGAGGDEAGGAGWLEAGARRRRGGTPALGGEGGEPAHVGVARDGEQVSALVDEPEEDGVERRPARGIGRAGRLPGEIEELTGDAGASGGRRSGASGAPAVSRQTSSAGGTPSCRSARAAACHASNVGWISTVLTSSACHGRPPAARSADQPPFGPAPAGRSWRWNSPAGVMASRIEGRSPAGRMWW